MEKLKIGTKEQLKKTFSIQEVKSFANTSLDTNPVHLDDFYAQKMSFKKPIVQGMLVASLFGGILGSKLPGNGTIYLGQDLKFIKPTFVGEEVTACIELIKIRDDKPIFTFETKCYNSKGELTIDGIAVIKYVASF